MIKDKLMISLIAAMGNNRVIGNKGKIPWYLPADFAHFKKTTMGHPVIMGRTTFESIGKPLPGRTNIVLTTRPLSQEGIVVFADLSSAVAYAKTLSPKVFVIGGARVYAEALPIADRLHLTRIDGLFDGDTFFPEIYEDEWAEHSKTTYGKDTQNTHSMTFVVYERKR